MVRAPPIAASAGRESDELIHEPRGRFDVGASELPGIYKVPAYRARGRAIATNKAPTAPYRGVSRPQIVLVMDEATASVDPETEATLQRSIHRVMEGRTSIVIANRLIGFDNCLFPHFGQTGECDGFTRFDRKR